MEVFNVHHPLVFVFGLLGNIISTGVYFAPLPTFIEIWKQKSTMGFQSFPYVVSLFSALLWLYYAFLKGGDTFLLISINALGTFIESLYIIIFLLYATPNTKKQTFKGLSATLVLCLVISIGTMLMLQGETRVLVVGWVCVGISVAVFAAPLTIVFEVVRTESVEFMPLPLSCFLTLSATMWFGYGMSLKDICVTVPNVLGFILGVVQMGVYAYYRKAKVSKVSEKKPKEHIMINILSANSEVHPVDSGRNSEAAADADVDADDEKEKKEKESVVLNVKQLTDTKSGVVVMCAT